MSGIVWLIVGIIVVCVGCAGAARLVGPRRTGERQRAQDAAPSELAGRDGQAGTVDESKTFLRFDTMFGPLLVYLVEYRPGELVRVMDVAGAFQSATYIDDDKVYEPVFDYFRAYDVMFEAGIPIRNTLMIGGGGYAYPKHLIATHPECRMDVVEVDPQVTLIAERYFYLDRLIAEFDLDENDRLALICQDGRTFLETYAHAVETGAPNPYGPEQNEDDGWRGDAAEGPAARYDAVLNDTFKGREAVAALADEGAARLVHEVLVPGGLYLSNVISALEGEQAATIEQIAATLHTAFAHVYALPCGDAAPEERDNRMVLATDGPYRIAGAVEL
jgi:spermidine synthase